MTTVEEAFALTARGLHVFPVDHPDLTKCIGIRTADHDPDTCTQRGKHPYVPFTKQASIDPKTVAMWFTGHRRNIGIACGPSELLIVDEDVPDVFILHASSIGEGVPDTFTVATGKGRHYYFRAPDGVKLGNTTGVLPAGIDIRAGNAYVVAPTSQHANGAIYSVERDAPVAPCPDWLLDALTARPTTEWVDVAGYAPALDRVPAVIKGPIAGRQGGERHEVLVSYASSMRARNVPIGEAEILMRDVWRRCQQPPDCDTAITIEEALGKLHDCYERYGVADNYRTVATDGDPEGAPRLWLAADLKPAAQPQWLAKGRIPRGAVSLLVGDEGIGKSLLWVWVVAAVTSGKPLPEFGIPQRDPAHVILVCTEDDWSTTVLPRLIVAEADVSKIQVICTEDDGSGAPIFPRDLFLIREADPAPALVVVDAWLDTVPAGLSVRDPQHARQALHPWKELAGGTDAAVLLLTHTNRVASANARDRYGATGELRKKARMTLFAQSDDEGQLVVGPEKTNTSAPLPASVFGITSVQHFEPSPDGDGTVPLLVYAGDSDRTAREHIADNAEAGSDEPGGNPAKVFIYEYLLGQGGEADAGDVLKAGRAAGFGEQELKDARRRHRKPRIASRKASMGDGWVWAIVTDEGGTRSEGGIQTPEGGEGGSQGGIPLGVPPTPPSTVLPPSGALPPGGLTGATPGQTERVQEALANARTGQTALGADVTKDGTESPRDHSRFTPDLMCFHCDKPVAGKQQDEHGRYAHITCQREAS